MERKKVLAVDDEPAFCKFIEKFLGQLGYQSGAVHNGLDAVEYVKNNRPDVILLDIRMPGIDGLETLNRIRNLSEDYIVIMLTASEDISNATFAIEKGASGFLRKPVNLKELQYAIESALEKRELIFQNRDYQKGLEEKVAEQTASIREMYLELKQASLETVRALAEAIDAKDPYTRGHCNRVTAFSLKLGEAASLGREELEDLEYGALLHDIGKIGIRGAVLNKQGQLTDEEYDHIKSHPATGERIIHNIPKLKRAGKVVRGHHERFDGKGYPDGLAGGETDILARIAGIADAYDAMTSDRPYRKGMPVERSLDILKENKGSQFDPVLVELFINEKIYLIEE